MRTQIRGRHPVALYPNSKRMLYIFLPPYIPHFIGIIPAHKRLRGPVLARGRHIFRRWRSKRYGLHFPVPTYPDARNDHQRRASAFERPPEEIRRQRARVEGGDEQVEEVDGQGEIWDKFRARDEEEDWDDSVHRISLTCRFS
jgi:hypothetical protein